MRNGLQPGLGVKCAFDEVKQHISTIDEDRILQNDIKSIIKLIKTGNLLAAVETKIKLL